MIKKILCAALASWAAFASAAEPAFPDHAVVIVVPFSAGGVADVLPRQVGQKLSEKWGVPVLIENKVGASGNIGMAFVARAKPDGYTLGLAPAGNLTVNPVLFPNLPFNTAKDLAPVSLLAMSPNVLVVNSALPVHTVQELIAYGKSHPHTLSFASPGTGSGAHLAGELFNQETGSDMLHVPYAGIAPAINDLIGGTVNVMFAGVSTIVGQVQAGKLRALAIAGPARLDALPGVPTVAEGGVSPFDVTSWYGLVAPTGLPPAVRQKLAADIASVLAQPDIRSRFAELGVVPGTLGPDAFGKLIRDETVKWTGILTKAGVKPLE